MEHTRLSPPKCSTHEKTSKITATRGTHTHQRGERSDSTFKKQSKITANRGPPTTERRGSRLDLDPPSHQQHSKNKQKTQPPGVHQQQTGEGADPTLTPQITKHLLKTNKITASRGTTPQRDDGAHPTLTHHNH